MSMTRKDFEALAAALRKAKVNDDTLNAVSLFCESQNPKFNGLRFIAAVRGEPAAKPTETLAQLAPMMLNELVQTLRELVYHADQMPGFMAIRREHIGAVIARARKATGSR